MYGSKRVAVRDLNPHILCALCGGYLIQATTVIECLHSFCRTCIVNFLETSKVCPICDVQVHKTRPLLNIRPDQTLQSLVYKLVPGLFQDEMRRRREFHATLPQSDLEDLTLEERGEASLEKEYKDGDDHISLALQMVARNTDGNFSVQDTRYLLCPSEVTVKHLKKFITAKFQLDSRHEINLFRAKEELTDDLMLQDIALVYSWHRDVPMNIVYTVVMVPNVTSRKMSKCKEKMQSTNSVECEKLCEDPPSLQSTESSFTAQKSDSRDALAKLLPVPSSTASTSVLRTSPTTLPMPCVPPSLTPASSRESMPLANHRPPTSKSVNLKRDSCYFATRGPQILNKAHTSVATDTTAKKAQSTTHSSVTATSLNKSYSLCHPVPAKVPRYDCKDSESLNLKSDQNDLPPVLEAATSNVCSTVPCSPDKVSTLPSRFSQSPPVLQPQTPPPLKTPKPTPITGFSLPKTLPHNKQDHVVVSSTSHIKLNKPTQAPHTSYRQALPHHIFTTIKTSLPQLGSSTASTLSKPPSTASKTPNKLIHSVDAILNKPQTSRRPTLSWVSCLDSHTTLPLSNAKKISPHKHSSHTNTNQTGVNYQTENPSKHHSPSVGQTSSNCQHADKKSYINTKDKATGSPQLEKGSFQGNMTGPPIKQEMNVTQTKGVSSSFCSDKQFEYKPEYLKRDEKMYSTGFENEFKKHVGLPESHKELKIVKRKTEDPVLNKTENKGVTTDLGKPSAVYSIEKTFNKNLFCEFKGKVISDRTLAKDECVQSTMDIQVSNLPSQSSVGIKCSVPFNNAHNVRVCIQETQNVTKTEKKLPVCTSKQDLSTHHAHLNLGTQITDKSSCGDNLSSPNQATESPSQVKDELSSVPLQPKLLTTHTQSQSSACAFKPTQVLDDNAISTYIPKFQKHKALYASKRSVSCIEDSSANRLTSHGNSDSISNSQQLMEKRNWKKRKLSTLEFSPPTTSSDNPLNQSPVCVKFGTSKNTSTEQHTKSPHMFFSRQSFDNSGVKIMSTTQNYSFHEKSKSLDKTLPTPDEAKVSISQQSQSATVSHSVSNLPTHSQNKYNPSTRNVPKYLLAPHLNDKNNNGNNPLPYSVSHYVQSGNDPAHSAMIEGKTKSQSLTAGSSDYLSRSLDWNSVSLSGKHATQSPTPKMNLDKSNHTGDKTSSPQCHTVVKNVARSEIEKQQGRGVTTSTPDNFISNVEVHEQNVKRNNLSNKIITTLNTQPRAKSTRSKPMVGDNQTLSGRNVSSVSAPTSFTLCGGADRSVNSGYRHNPSGPRSGVDLTSAIAVDVAASHSPSGGGSRASSSSTSPQADVTSPGTESRADHPAALLDMQSSSPCQKAYAPLQYARAQTPKGFPLDLSNGKKS